MQDFFFLNIVFVDATFSLICIYFLRISYFTTKCRMQLKFVLMHDASFLKHVLCTVYTASNSYNLVPLTYQRYV